MSNNLKKILFNSLFVIIGLAIGLGYGFIKLNKERNACELEISNLEEREESLKNKYTEQKALATQLSRTKAVLEGQKRTAEAEVERLNKEREEMFGDSLKLAEGLKKEISGLEKKLADLVKKNESVQEEKNSLEKGLAAANQTIKERENEIKTTMKEKKEVENNLKRTSQDLERSETKNARLCIIAEELVSKFNDKGFLTTLLHKEPLIQVGRVELEHLVQEYSERIDKEKVILSDSDKKK